ncbi:hypothetical protein K491DRAFT_707140 [Lophiostoma macrostomum CBS 122681]|uniref:Uncharacterized protein n=1 Tax=Lophiostoma macrostomum CBS 122681 TaxID=1314788 RepID=A0A6A6SXH3_9PLEO|nr:hypothetical protein K491DRAFT_707140 [Lophiostoma macrostomum CBS 122681]
MPDAAADADAASDGHETRPTQQRAQNSHCAPPPPPPPAARHLMSRTPATTPRQAVPLGVLSAVWGSHSSPVAPASTALVDPAIPAIITHAPSPDAQEPPPSELAASASSSVPSTTTTLTNTLPPTQSAALRALNAPAFQSPASSSKRSRSAKSESSRTSLSSQPVVVRTYSGSRHGSRPSSGVTSPRLFPSMNGHGPHNPSALSAGLARRSERLPAVDDFSFSAILRAVDPEIRDAIDAIAEICARSRMSLADEYDAHLPPQGEITGTGPGWAAGMGALVGRGRIARTGPGWSAGENTLTAVPEASSSSERLAGESRGSITADTSKKRSQSAYGSLKSVISGGSGKRKAADTDQDEQRKPHGPAWAVHPSSMASENPAITLVSSPQASNQLSLDLSSTIKDIPDASVNRPATAVESSELKRSHRRQTSTSSMPPPRTRSSTLSSIASWIPWSRPAQLDSHTSQELTKAEARLREMLIQSQHSSLGKGKAPVSVS